VVESALPDDWLLRLQTRLLPAPEHRREHWHMGGTRIAPTPAMLAKLSGEPVAAAVLVPLFEQQGEPQVLLTERSSQLSQHAGQISFPGGRIEARDHAPLAAALRETAEEVGVDAGFVRPIGYLPDHIVLTGFRITPVVAQLQAGFELRTDAREVAAVFSVPLRVVCDLTRYRRSTRVLHGFTVEAHDLPYDGRLIWGATAGMLLSLRELLLEEQHG
jgi:8-oxo-dGTP pyrophosphatase MutT (NUDIX family)